MSVRVRTLTAADESAWSVLYAGYRAFYDLPADDAAVRSTWDWVSREAHGLRGIVAVDSSGEVVGLANLRIFARPATTTRGLFVDDLFTAPAARGSGVATALLSEAAAVASREGLSVVRWITAADNHGARRLYDRVAAATPWVTYDLPPTPVG